MKIVFFSVSSFFNFSFFWWDFFFRYSVIVWCFFFSIRMSGFVQIEIFFFFHYFHFMVSGPDSFTIKLNEWMKNNLENKKKLMATFPYDFKRFCCCCFSHHLPESSSWILNFIFSLSLSLSPSMFVNTNHDEWIS